MQKQDNPPKRHRFGQTLSQHWQMLLMAIPAIVLLFLFAYMPMFGTIIAFKRYKVKQGIFGSKWMDPIFRNFEILFRPGSQALVAIRNTLLLNLMFIVVGTVFAVFLALMFNELQRQHYKRILQSLSILPNFISTVAVGIFVQALLGYENGTINALISSAGGNKINFYANPNMWPAILLMTNIWKGAGYSSVVYLAAITGIDATYYEAARIDGATRWGEIRYITLPLLTPTVIVMTLLAIGKIMNADFGFFYNVTGDNPNLYPTTDVLDTFIYRTLRKTGDMGISSAVGLFQSTCSLILVLISNFAARRIDEGSALF
ncbi:MAG: sugar ABC transporter permease [Clostridia bacterium]|nr:sugar ABC transporter permease [Clostridia bacterium]